MPLNPKQVITPKFRASYVNVFRPRENKKEDGTVVMEYDICAIFAPGADLKPITAAITAAATEKWGEDKSKWPKNLRNPIRKNEEREKGGKLPDGMEAGGHFMNYKSKQKPGLVDQNRQAVIDETVFYSGCFARAQVHAFAYENKGNKGVSFGLDNLQKMADGDPLSGRQRAEDAFEPVADSSAPAGGTEDPFAS
jgi:hypothetical protein